MKKKTVLFSIALLLTCATLTLFGALGNSFAVAETTDSGLYARFNGITAVYGDDDGFAVSDEDGFYFFSGNTSKIEVSTLAGADAIFGNVNNRFALCGGIVYTFDINSVTGGAVTPVAIIDDASFSIKFALFNNDSIYCASATEIRKYNTDGTRDDSFLSPDLTGKNILGLASAGDKIYYSVQKNRNYSNVYKLDGELFTTVKSDGTIVGGSNNLYTIMRDGSIVAITDDSVETIVDNDFVTAVYADNGGLLYYATDIDEVILYNVADGNETILAASESARDGYYAQPSFSLARMEKLVICDTLNDRLAVIGSGDRSLRSVKVVDSAETVGTYNGKYISITRPSSTFIDNNGKIYVSYSSRKIAVFNQDFSDFTSYSCPDSVAGKITMLAGDNANNIYAMIGDCIYKVDFNGDAEYTLVASGVNAMTFSADGSKLYLAIGSGVYYASASNIIDALSSGAVPTIEAVFTTSDAIASLAVDRADNVFYTIETSNETNIIKHNAEGDSTIAVIPSVGAKISISLSSVGGAEYGDLIVTDNGGSRVLIYDGNEVGVDLSVSSTLSLRAFDTENIIRATINTCSIYGTPNETDAIGVVPADYQLIVAKYNVPEFPDYSYVYYEDKISGKLLRGFVFRSNLTEPIGYSDPPAESGYVYSDGYTIYEMPSFYGGAAETDDIIWKNVPKNTTVNLLSFNDYTAGNTRWYRVSVEHDGNTVTGYIPVGAVSVRGFVPDSIHPQYNAVIKSYNNSLGAKTYSLSSDGRYVEIEDSFLLNGTKIEVVGSFDTSVKYTEIKYYDDRLGTCSCYVETVYIDYNNISVVQVVAIVIAVVTTILLVVLLVRIYAKKRKL